MTDSDPMAHKRALLARIQTEGTDAAYDALLSVCRDPKAPAPARATSATTLFRAAGYLDTKQGGAAKAPDEMSAAELQARIKELRSGQRAPGSSAPVDQSSVEDEPDIFG